MRALVLDNDRRREVSSATGFSFARIKALRQIDEGPTSMGELAVTLGINASYTTVIVDDLESHHLVERRIAERDRRTKVVVATPLGVTTADRAKEILDRAPSEIDSLDVADLHTLVVILEPVHYRHTLRLTNVTSDLRRGLDDPPAGSEAPSQRRNTNEPTTRRNNSGTECD